PTAAPVSVDPARKNPAVELHRDPRARSPSGVMLASIDSPHGDHAEYTPANSAHMDPARASATGVVTSPPRRSAGRPGTGWDAPARCRPPGAPRPRAPPCA